MAYINSHQLTRFESFGDNCELGFVLRSLGYDEGGVFKWARLEIENLTAALAGDFKNIFDFENLLPHRLAMVYETNYGIAWHSSLLCHVVNGKIDFIDALPERLVKHKAEIRKFDYLIAKLLARLQAGGSIFVFKSNAGLSIESVQALDRQLARLAGGAPYQLLTVQVSADPQNWGRVERVSDTVMAAWVDRLANYNTADDFSAEPWHQLLESALALCPCDDWEARRKGAAAIVSRQFRHLPFPEGGAGNATFQSEGSESVQLLSGNIWSRRVADAFRLHASQDLRAPACLKWTGVVTEGVASALTVSVALAVETSLPVTMELRVSEGNLLRALWSVELTGMTPVTHEVLIPTGVGELTIELWAHRVFDMPSNLVSVVDIEPLEIRRSMQNESSRMPALV